MPPAAPSEPRYCHDRLDLPTVPQAGADTAALLGGAGYAAAEIKALYAARVVA